jgi:hypothetical protein
MMTETQIAQIIDFEEGTLDAVETVDLFSGLVASGMVWHLQGFYGRTAEALIDQGYIDQDGRVVRYPEEF